MLFRSRNSLVVEASRRGWNLFVPPFSYTTDNAAMIGITGYYKYLRDLVGEINKIGVNINQIARVVNTNQSIYKEHIEVLLVKLDEIWKLIDEKF